jgi:outer membrane immunogenic protein
MSRNFVSIVAISSLLIVASLNVASAADIPTKAPPPAAPTVTWTGCYVDAGVGYGLWTQEHTDSTVFGAVPGTTISQTDGGKGWLGRLGGGCDYQVAPRWVVGAFGDYDFMSLSGTNSPLEEFLAIPISTTAKESGAWNGGARVGYLLAPTVLAYADIGFTQAHFNSQSETTAFGVPIGFGYGSKNYDGIFWGGGAETALAGWLPGLPAGLFLRTEYRYADYGRRDLTEISLATGMPDGNVEHVRSYVQTLTTSLVWRFNWNAPVAAPASAAGATHSPLLTKAPPAAPAVASWTGCYVDGGVGYGEWNQKHTDTTAAGTSVSQTDGGKGWLGRVGGGCDYQVAPRWVVGAFGDYDFMSLSGTNSPLESSVGPFFPVSATAKESGAWNGGARVGYLLDPTVLAYTAVGFTQTHFNSQSLTTNLGVPTGFGYSSQNYDGIFFGGGTETALAGWLPGLPPDLLLRNEYRFSDYGRRDLAQISFATGAPDGSVEHTRPYVQTLTTALVWRFN